MIDVVLLSWRESGATVARHHAAVREMLGPDWRGRAVLFENAGTTAARAEVAKLPGEAVVLRARRNMGFARAMDLAIAACSAPYVLLVNSDGTPSPDMADALRAALEAHPGAVWAAPGVHGPDEPGHPEGPPHPEDELSGTALLIRRERFLALGAFDPLFFFYNEDFDASRRIRAAGGTLLRVPAVRFDHGKGGRSWRGVLLREWHFARTDAMLVWIHAGTRRQALRRLVRGRARSLAGHAQDRCWPAVLAIAAACVAAPVGLARAERRRRRPWDGAQLREWLSREHPVDRVRPWPPRPSREPASTAAGSSPSASAPTASATSSR